MTLTATACSSKGPSASPSSSAGAVSSSSSGPAPTVPSAEDADAALRAAMQRTAERSAEFDVLRGDDGRAAVGRPWPPEPVVVPPGVRWPVVSLEGDVVRLDGAEAGSVKHLAAGSAPGKLDELFVQLKTWRERWKEQHPKAPFPGLVGVRLPPDASGAVVKSALTTAVYAGFPFLHVQSATAPADVHLVVAQIPGPPTFEPRLEPPAVLHVTATPTSAALEWRKAGAPGLVETVALEPQAALDQALCASWRRDGAHRDASDPKADLALVRATPETPFSAFVRALGAVARCTRSEGGRQALWAAYTPR